MNLKKKSPNTNIYHENTHGVLYMNDLYRNEINGYAEPRNKHGFNYHNLNFNRDGTSNTKEIDMAGHLQEYRENNEVLGEDKMSLMWDRAVNDNTPDSYDTTVDPKELFDPDDPDINEGDWFKIKLGSGEEREFVVLSAKPQVGDSMGGHTKYRVAKPDGIETAQYAHEDGTPSFYNDDTEFIGYSEADTSLPVEDRDNPYVALAEAANLFWMEQVFKLSKITQDNGRPKQEVADIVAVGQRYSLRNPVEVMTMLTEVMLSDSNTVGVQPSDITEIAEKYPTLVDRWLNIWNPSEAVKNELDKIGYEY